jgi:hypothetical protein
MSCPDDFRTVNRGPMVGGPFDGQEHMSCYYERDYPPDGKPSWERTYKASLFSKNFPEGAIYHYDDEKKAWIFQNRTMEEDGESGDHRKVFDAFGIKPADPL